MASAAPLSAEAPDLDPISFEVIKHRLWQINDEQALAIKTISSSPIVVEGNDFNVGLFTADGQLTTAGIGSLVHVGTMGKSIRSIMELASDIEEGDVFLLNDPFLGALHQSDVVIASPLFHEGEILLWVANVLHHPDVGGIDEGSFCISARTLYQDPPRYFLKIVSRGRPVAEAEHTFVTNSRLPHLVALDLRAQIGAIHVAKTRLAALVAERGAGTVRSVMHRSIAVAEAQIREKLARLPEGEWRGEAYMDGDRVGSEAIVRVMVRLVHDANGLRFDYAGSDPQVEAAVNCTYHACVAGSAVPLFSFLCQGDIDWNEGMFRVMAVEAPEGSVANASFPAPVSICTIGFRWLVTVAAAQAVARMFDASEVFRDRVCASWSVAANCNNLFGVGRDGKRTGALLSDHRGGGAGGRSFADGISQAGQVTSFASNIGNVEGAEWKLPVLYLFRRQLADSGGAGAWRGGLSSMAAVTPHGVDRLILKATNTAGTDQTNAHGIRGGYPGAGSQTIVVRGGDPLGRLAAHDLEPSLEGLGGAADFLPSKASGVLEAGEVLVFYPPGGGGYGDPLDRPAEAVAADAAKGWVSRTMARALYGTVLAEDGAVAAETEALRRRFREERRGWTGEGAAETACPRCGPGAGLVARRSEMGTAGPWAARRFGGRSPNFELMESACAGCGTLLSVSEVRK